jgi:hypothetical protein
VKIIAVVGTGSGCGKTTVVCRILRAIPGLGAVKISPREGPNRVEWGRGGRGKDTDLYADSGASCVARIVAPREEVVATWSRIKKSFEKCPGVVVEGSRSVDFPGEHLVIFVVGSDSSDAREDRKERFSRISDINVLAFPHMSDINCCKDQLPSHFYLSDNKGKRFGDASPSLSDHDFVDRIEEFLSFHENGR